MSEEYPLYPELTAQGKEEAQKIMDSFKPKIKSMIESIMDELYTDVSYYVESDHWTNYRNAIMNGFRNYGDRKPNYEHDYKELRKAIYRNHREEIVNDLNQDLVKENEDLRAQINTLLESQRNRMY